MLFWFLLYPVNFEQRYKICNIGNYLQTSVAYYKEEEKEKKGGCILYILALYKYTTYVK